MQYVKNPPLLETDLLADPQAQFSRWLADAEAAGQIEPGAMTLATADAAGRPSARMVLFKGFHEGRYTFYTHHDGRKGLELAANPQVALVFWWDRLERQVRVEGRAERLPRALAEAYFHSRPRGSQLGACASRQSRVIAARELLDERLAQVEAQYREGEIPLPEFWGGYGVSAESVEFWQGRRNRMHDRVLYRRAGDGWEKLRLEP